MCHPLCLGAHPRTPPSDPSLHKLRSLLGSVVRLFTVTWVFSLCTCSRHTPTPSGWLICGIAVTSHPPPLRLYLQSAPDSSESPTLLVTKSYAAMYIRTYVALPMVHRTLVSVCLVRGYLIYSSPDPLNHPLAYSCSALEAIT